MRTNHTRKTGAKDDRENVQSNHDVSPEGHTAVSLPCFDLRGDYSSAFPKEQSSCRQTCTCGPAPPLPAVLDRLLRAQGVPDTPRPPTVNLEIDRKARPRDLGRRAEER